MLQRFRGAVSARYYGIFANPDAKYFLLSMLVLGIGAGLYGGVLNNYLFEVLSIGRFERGVVEFPRETPGLLLVVLTALLYRLSEVKILRTAIVCCLLGIVGLSLSGSIKTPAIAMIVLWSIGEHLLMPVRDSITMHMAKPDKQGLALGASGSVSSVGQLIGYYLAPAVLLAAPLLGGSAEGFARYQVVFRATSAVVLAAVLASLLLKDRRGRIRRERLCVKRKFLRYYVLEVFFGARKQVFITFGPYVLIVMYHTQAKEMALLYAILTTVNIVAGPTVGRLIDRLGYRAIVLAEASSVSVLCLVYGFSHRVLPVSAAFYVVCGAFILDAVMFCGGMARSMYVKSLSDSQNELTATLSTGISVNHLISILIAVVGGGVWEKLGVETLFSLAAMFGVCSVLFTLTLPKRIRPSPLPQASEPEDVVQGR